MNHKNFTQYLSSRSFLYSMNYALMACIFLLVLMILQIFFQDGFSLTLGPVHIQSHSAVQPFLILLLFLGVFRLTANRLSTSLMEQNHPRHVLVLIKKFTVFSAPALLFLAVLLLYLHTLLPGIGYFDGLGDTPKFHFTGRTLSLPHATGFPLYILLTWLFSWVPVGTIAFRINLFSAVFGAATIVVIYYILLRFTRFRWLAWILALTIAFGKYYWYFSVIAEVYSLDSFLTALVILFFFKWQKSQIANDLYKGCLFFGLALSVHLINITLFPVLFLFVLLYHPKTFLHLKDLFLAVFFFLLGLLPYLFLVIRSFQNPLFSEPLFFGYPPINLSNFLYYVSGRQYAHNVLFFSPGIYVKELLPWFTTKYLYTSFLLEGIVLGMAGLVLLIKKNWKLFIIIIAAFAGNFCVTLDYYTPDIGAYFFNVYFFFIIAIIIFADTIVKWFQKHLTGQLVIKTHSVLFVVFLLLPVHLFSYNKTFANQSSNTYFDYVLHDTLRSLPSGTLLLIEKRHDYYYYGYVSLVYVDRLFAEKGLDVKYGYKKQWDENTISEALNEGRPVIIQKLPKYFAEHNPQFSIENKEHPVHTFFDLEKVINKGDIVIISIMDEGTGLLTKTHFDLLKKWGFSTSLQSKFRYSYAAIGVAGSQAGAGKEILIPSEAKIKIKKGDIIGSTGVASPSDISIISRGDICKPYKDPYSSILINSNEFSLNRRGMNLVVLDPQTGKIRFFGNVDTFADSENKAQTLYPSLYKITLRE